MSDLMSLKDAHAWLKGKVSLSTLYLAVENKTLPHYRVSGNGGKAGSGKILVREADLLAWLESQKVNAGIVAPPEHRDPPTGRPS